MSSARPLPTVIGLTENALRALLSKILAGTRIETYSAWVILNAMSRSDAQVDDESWRMKVADSLKIGLASLNDEISRLSASGLVGKDGAVTEMGTAELAAGRTAVSETTAKLLEGINEEELMVAAAVLDRVRDEANKLLRH